MTPLEYLQEEYQSVYRALKETLRHEYAQQQNNDFYDECVTRLDRISAGDGGKQARSPRRARSNPLKPLRGECRVISGVTVVTNARATFYTRGRGRSGRPAFPAPSVFWGETARTTRAHRAARMRMHGWNGLFEIRIGNRPHHTRHSGAREARALRLPSDSPIGESGNGEWSEFSRQLAGNEFCLHFANHKPRVSWGWE
jgi:hypothetical protein